MFGILWTVSYTIAVVGLSVYGLHRLWMVMHYWRLRGSRLIPPGHLSEVPMVTVQLPIFNERYVVERLIRSVADLDYPRERLEIQVLDDSTDDTSILAADLCRKLAMEGLDIRHIHRTDRTGFKAGALAAGLESAHGEFIAIFDADFVPPKDMLRRTLDWFSDPEIGMIQTRWGHLNRSGNMLTRVQALLLDGHLLIEQTVRNRTGRFFNFNGTAGIWRKTCIEGAGGWQHDTLTEDLDLSYRAQMAGWRFMFIPDLVTPAELPMEMNAFKAQQHRWAKGAVQTCKKLLPRIWSSQLPLPVKFEATFHLTSNFAYLLLALMAILVQPDLAKAGFRWQEIALVDIPIFLAASFSIFVFYGTVLWEQKRPWYKIILYMPLLIGVGIGLCLNNAKAVLEAVLNHQTGFTRTPKYGSVEGRETRRKKSYVSAKSLLPLAELLLCFLYAYYIAYAIEHRLWVSLPFFVLFFLGFGYAGLASLFHLSPLFPRLIKDKQV